MPDFQTRLTTGMHRAGNHLGLALIPILFALLQSNKIVAITSFQGGHIGFKLGIPYGVVTIWQFVSVPQSGVNVTVGQPLEQLPLSIVTVPLLVLVQAGVTAGYFGSLQNALNKERYNFIENVQRHFLPFLVLTVLPYLMLVPFLIGVFGLGTATGSVGAVGILILPAILLLVVVGYLFYPVPYLVVLRDTGLVHAAQQSYALARYGDSYLPFTAGFALFVLIVSPVATALVVNLPLLGLPIGVISGGFLGLTANFATMRFIADIDPESAINRTWDTESDTDQE